MANEKCKRCGNFYEPNKHYEATVPVNGSVDTFNAITLERLDFKNNTVRNVKFTHMNLCPNCSCSFDEWWNEPNTGL